MIDRRLLPLPLFALTLAAPHSAGAQDGPEQFTVQGVTAPAPTVPVSSTEPQTVLDARYLRDVVPPTASYDEIIRIAPNVLSVSPNGPGLGQNAVLNIRGFTDGQYNVTFDGLPFADTDDFTHHTGAYFAPEALREVVVDRGPGTAATIGDATFGGTVALHSLDPGAVAAVSASATGGTWNTARGGLRLDTGAIGGGNGPALVVEAERADSDGALSFEPSERSSLFAKLVDHPAPDVSVTLVANGQWMRDRIASGATRAQIAANGPGFGLTDDPTQQNDLAFNGDRFHTDFEYAALRWTPSGWDVQATPYTYALYRRFANGEDVNGETPNGTAFSPDDVPGQDAYNSLRAWGGVLRVERRLNALTLRAGLWAEHQFNSRGMFEIDDTLCGASNPVLPPVPGVPGSESIDRLQQDSLDTYQPYVEAEWRPLPGLSVIPGLRWAFADRTVSAPVMEGTRLPTYGTADSDTPLPSIAVRQRLDTNWSAYAQLAEGALAPQLQLLDVSGPLGSVSGEKTLNMQAGLVRHGAGWSVGLDGYVIQFDDLIGTRTIGDETQVFTTGGATYEGLEAEATIGIGRGFSLYGNASLSRARDHDTDLPLPNAPDETLAGGLLYSRGGWSGALLEKWIGSRYGDVGEQAGLAPFGQLDLSVARTLRLPGDGHTLRLALQAQNLTDDRKIVALAGYTVAAGTPLWFTDPGRAVFGTVTASF